MRFCWVLVSLTFYFLPLMGEKTEIIEDLVLEADLTNFFIPHKAFLQTPEKLERAFPKGDFNKNPYFSWLDKGKTRALFQSRPATNIEIELSILNKTVPIDEIIIDFRNNQYYGCTISVFNKGDSGTISSDEFEKRNDSIASTLNKELNTHPKKRDGNLEKGILTSGYTWQSTQGIAILDYNLEAPKEINFVRLRVATPKAKSPYLNALQDNLSTSITEEELLKNLSRSENTVIIENIPMVDQGNKDYCVVASVQRVFEYYQIPCDMHQLAQLAETDSKVGTDTIQASSQIDKIDHFFNTEYTLVAVKQPDGLFYKVDGQYLGEKVPEDTLLSTIVKTVDKGIPVLWALELGKYKETPPPVNQTSGGHMRLITGYDLKNRILYFSDSWGAEHDHKRMNLDDAIKATTGIFTLEPSYLEPNDQTSGSSEQ